MVGMGAIRQPHETWRQTVTRMAAPRGVVKQCLAIFDREVGNGEDEALAAGAALGEYDCLIIIDPCKLVG